MAKLNEWKNGEQKTNTKTKTLMDDESWGYMNKR